MLAVSNSQNLFQNKNGWEFVDNSMGIIMGGATEEQALADLEDFNLFDSCGVSDYPLLEDHDFDGGREESPPSSGTGSGSRDDHDYDQLLTKKRKNHNESERDRRKKINELYCSLRSLLPASDLKKKLSIPATVARVLKYIPELQNEVEDLTQKKQELLSKTSASLEEEEEDDDDEDEDQGKVLCFEGENRGKKPKITKERRLSSSSSSSMCSISMENVEEREIVIHITTSQSMTSLSEVLLLLEKPGFLVIDVSCFQSFGGRTFYDLHLSMEGSNVINHEMLEEKLLNLIKKHN